MTRPLRVRLDDPGDQFKIVPNPTTGVGVATIDLRVGHVFLSARRSVSPSVSVADLAAGSTAFEESRIFVRPNAYFVMQPHQFVLASTFEYLCMPDDLGGNIQSRSTYGRMGIIAATAAYIGPGYRGSPTLELVNVGEVPVHLEPYTPICQLVVMPAPPLPDGESIPPSRYHMLTRPTAYQPTLRERLERRQARVDRAGP